MSTPVMEPVEFKALPNSTVARDALDSRARER
jgi:hypothetical protein